MHVLSFDDALTFYSRAGHRLPSIAASQGQTPRELADVSAILDDIDVVLLDAWGVLNVGKVAIPGAAQAVAAMKRRGCHVLLLSNDASDKGAMAANHRARGFPFLGDDIISTQELLPLAVKRFQDVKRWGVIAYAGWPIDQLGAGYAPLDESLDKFDGFIFLSVAQWSGEDQAALSSALIKRPRPVIVGNPDVVAPEETGLLSAKPGYFAHRLADEVGATPIFLGKPFPDIFALAKSRFHDVPADRFLMVGDTPHTDILGAQAAGMKSALITGHGFLKGQDWRAVCARTGIWPDFVAATL